MNSVTYSWSINLSRLTLAEKSVIKNLGRATPDLVIYSYQQAEYHHKYLSDVVEHNFNIYIAKRWFT